MRTSLLPVVLVALLLAADAFGQTTENTAASPSDAAAKEQSLDSISQAELVRVLRAIQDRLESHESIIQQNQAAIGDIQENLSNDVMRTLAGQQQVLESISRSDRTGRPVLDIRANMDSSEEFAEDFREAVRRTHPETGTVAVRNLTGETQEIWINNQRHYVTDDQVQSFSVPLGTAVVELPNGTRTTWTIGPPEYEARVRLVPKRVTQRVELERPPVSYDSSASAPTVITTRMPTVPADVASPTNMRPGWNLVNGTYYYVEP